MGPRPPVTRSPVYLDASAAVKLVVEEVESAALATWLLRASDWVSSEILDVEVRCAVQRGAPTLSPVDDLLRQVELLTFSPAVRRRAGQPFAPRQRALDAIHLATALSIDAPFTLVSYDERQLAAADALGLQTASPA